jgi:hypothetical protein
VQSHYIYGIVESQWALAPDVPGLDGTPVYLIPWRNLAAVVGHAPLGGFAADQANAARHGAVVELVMQGGPILPMRFGTVLGERQRVITMLEEHSQAFEEALRRLRGRVEMGLKVLWETDGCTSGKRGEPVNLSTGPGSRYLLRRLEEERRAEAIRGRGETLIQAIQATLRPLANEWTLQRFPTPRLLLSAAYLIPGDRLQAFRVGVKRLGERSSRLRFLLTGPWPPYHFVNGAGNDSGRVFCS